MNRRRLAVALVAVSIVAAGWAPPVWRVHVIAQPGTDHRPVTVAGLELAVLGGSLLVTWSADHLAN